MLTFTTTAFNLFATALLLHKATGERAVGLSSIITAYKSIGPRMCAMRCSLYANCAAIQFRRENLYCELLKESSSTTYVQDESFTFSQKSSFELSESVCWPNPCSFGQKCTVLTSGNHICIDVDTALPEEVKSMLIAERELKNVGLGKFAAVYPDYTEPGVFFRPNDPGLDLNFETFVHTAPFDPAIHDRVFWVVDLLADYLVQRVEIHNRHDCCPGRMQDMDITVGSTTSNDQSTKLCGHFVGPGDYSQHVIFNCPELLYGRFVKLEIVHLLNSETYVNVAEVQVFAYG